MEEEKVIVHNDSETGRAIISIIIDPLLSIEDAVKMSVPSGIQYRIINRSDIPNDRYFRNAWEFNTDTNTITINVDKARDIHLNVVREKRKPLLEALDIEFQKALENNDDTTDIVTRKRQLRDITGNIKTATTIEEILATDI